MNVDYCVVDIEGDEGYEQYPYTDSEGYLSIGIGMCIDKRVPGTGMSREVARYAVRLKVQQIAKDLTTAIPWWVNQPEPIQNVLVNMSYQLGVNGLLGFKHFLALCQEGSYLDAANAGLDSQWAKQCPTRAKKLMDVVNGEFYKE